MFAMTVARTIKTTALAMALAGTITFGASPQPAAAALSDSAFGCGEGTSTFNFRLPYEGSRGSQFAYRLDRGAWQYTSWYWSAYGAHWVWNGTRWETTVDGSGPILLAPDGRHMVEAWEYRWVPGTANTWVNLGSCTTTSFFSDYLTYN